jgi:hypothetical protein
MAGLPKQYAKMGFKRGWAAYKALQSSARNTRRVKVNTVAKRRFARVRSFSRRATRNVRSGGNKFKPLLDAAIGGAIAGLALKYAPPQYNTPTTRLIVGAAAVYMGSGLVRDAGKVLIGMEAARMTTNLVGGSSSSSQMGTSSVSQTVY